MSLPATDEATWEPAALETAAATAPERCSSLRFATHDGRRVVIKSSTSAGREVLRREAEVLRRARCAATLELIGVYEFDEHTAMVTVACGDRTLDATADLPAPHLLQALRSMAAAVSDLHRRGWVHGRLEEPHVVLSRRRRARLCSLAGAQPIDAGVGRRTAVRCDVEAMLDMVERIASAGAADSLSRSERSARRRLSVQLRRVVRAGRRTTDWTAADLTDQLRLLGGRSDPPSVGHRIRPHRVGAAAILTAAVATMAMSADAAQVGTPAAGPTTTGTDAAAAPGPTHSASNLPVDRVVVEPDVVHPTPVDPVAVDPTAVDPTAVDPVAVDRNLVHHGDLTYRVGSAGDSVAIGDWNCDGETTPALLRVDTGELFAFDAWAPPGSEVAARPVGTAPGATTIHAVHAPPAHGPACDRIGASGPHGEVEVIIHP